MFVCDCRTLCDESERSLRDAQQRLSIKDGELQSMAVKCDEMAARLSDSDKLCSNLKNEV